MSKGRFDWPVGRDGHASCVLSDPLHSQILVSGGWDKDNRLIKDAWILNVQTKSWKKSMWKCMCMYVPYGRQETFGPFSQITRPFIIISNYKGNILNFSKNKFQLHCLLTFHFLVCRFYNRLPEVRKKNMKIIEIKHKLITEAKQDSISRLVWI